jgi:hypothetical protein
MGRESAAPRLTRGELSYLGRSFDGAHPSSARYCAYMSATHPAQEVLDWTQRIIDACGPRPAGSANCLKAADLIAGDLKSHCDRVEVQSFHCRPWAFIWRT